MKNQHTEQPTAKGLSEQAKAEQAVHEASVHKHFDFIHAGYTLTLAKQALEKVGYNKPLHCDDLPAWFYKVEKKFLGSEFLHDLLDKYPSTDELVRNASDMLSLRQYLCHKVAYELVVTDTIILDDNGKAVYNSGSNYMLMLDDATSYKMIYACLIRTIRHFLGSLHLKDKISFEKAKELGMVTKLHETKGIADIIFDCFAKSGMADNVPDDFGQVLFDLAFSFVHPSQKVSGRLACFSTLGKMINSVTTPIRVGKFLDKIHLDEEIPARTYQAIATAVTAELVDLDALGKLITYHNSYDLLGWQDGYSNARGFHSCMTISSYDDEYYEIGDLGIHLTAECFATGFHGLPDNGLILAVMCHDDGGVVARAITFNKDGQNYYLKCYGDDRLEAYLTYKGYKQADGLPIRTILHTYREYDDEVEQYFYKKPYIDGDNNKARPSKINGVDCLIISKNGMIDLQNTRAYGYKWE